MQKPPGIAEAINWVAALGLLGLDRLDAEGADQTLGTVLKYREDLDLVRERGPSGWPGTESSGGPLDRVDLADAGRRVRAAAPRRRACP